MKKRLTLLTALFILVAGCPGLRRANSQDKKPERGVITGPYPGDGRVKFYVLTRDGVFTAEAGSREVLERGHKLMPLYYAADQVLTQLRLASEKNKR